MVKPTEEGPAPESRTRERPTRLAEKLYNIRIRLGLSQREMLDRIGFPKYHHAFVSMWERGHREPSLIALLRYARSIGASTDALIDDDLDLPRDDESTRRPSKGKKRRRNTT